MPHYPLVRHESKLRPEPRCSVAVAAASVYTEREDGRGERRRTSWTCLSRAQPAPGARRKSMAALLLVRGRLFPPPIWSWPLIARLRSEDRKLLAPAALSKGEPFLTTPRRNRCTPFLRRERGEKVWAVFGECGGVSVVLFCLEGSGGILENRLMTRVSPLEA